MIYKIVPGKKIGRTIGFPTLNLTPVKLKAEFGVYVCKVEFSSGATYDGVLHFGPRKTVDDLETLEIYLLNFNKEVYGKNITLILGEKIREIKTFKNLKELKKQIQKDVEYAQKTLTKKF